MELKFKRLSDKAIMPIRAHKSDAGLDLTATRIDTALNERGQMMLVYHTDLAVEIPEGYVGLLFPRSSIYKKTLAQTNSVGVVDSGYRGEIVVVYKSTTDVVPMVYQEGERFCQLVIVPIPEVEIVEIAELSETDRQDGGFGSTDEKIDSANTMTPQEDVENTETEFEDAPATTDEIPVEEIVETEE